MTGDKGGYTPGAYLVPLNRPDHPRAIIRILGAGVCGGLIIWLSLIPEPVQLVSFSGWSKVQHAAAYGVFTLVIGWACAALPRLSGCRWLLAIGVSVAFGGLMEGAQYFFTSTRHARFADLLADVTGAVLAWSAVKIAAIRAGK